MRGAHVNARFAKGRNPGRSLRCDVVGVHGAGGVQQGSRDGRQHSIPC